jgi:hypothetical protein
MFVGWVIGSFAVTGFTGLVVAISDVRDAEAGIVRILGGRLGKGAGIVL